MGLDADSATMEFAHIFDTTVLYKVTSTNKSNILILPDTFIIKGKTQNFVVFF